METTIRQQIRAITIARKDLAKEITKGVSVGGYIEEDIAAMREWYQALDDAIETLKGVEDVRRFMKLLGE